MKRWFGGKRRKEAQQPSAHYWEYYNRISFVAGKIRELGPGPCRVLDVGGATGDNLLKRFGIESVVTLDVDEHADIRSSAHQIPIADRTFDVATCIDTLEHIPGDLRGKVASELVRVAKRMVILVAPVDTPQNKAAEEIVFRYTKNLFIEEHRQYGLVDFERLKRELGGDASSDRIVRREEALLDDLLNWVVMMVHDRIDMSRLYQEVFFLENGFNPRRHALVLYLR